MDGGQKHERLTAYVVAWRYGDRSSAPVWQGGGFDWFYTPEAADEAFEREKHNADELASEGWTAYRFDYEPANPEDVTAEIDFALDDMCDSTPFRYPE